MKFLKEVFYTVCNDILAIINRSLAPGTVLSYFKIAVVQPLLKKTDLDSYIRSNHRPISQLPFLAEVLEKISFTPLLIFLNKNSLFEQF